MALATREGLARPYDNFSPSLFWLVLLSSAPSHMHEAHSQPFTATGFMCFTKRENFSLMQVWHSNSKELSQWEKNKIKWKILQVESVSFIGPTTPPTFFHVLFNLSNQITFCNIRSTRSKISQYIFLETEAIHHSFSIEY